MNRPNDVQKHTPVEVLRDIFDILHLPVFKVGDDRRKRCVGGTSRCHVDIDFAKKFGFKDVFAHGMLSMAFLGRLVTSWVPQKQVRGLGTRFTSITWVGDVITVSGKVTGKREKDGEQLVDLEVKCTNQNGQDTLQGTATVALN